MEFFPLGLFYHVWYANAVLERALLILSWEFTKGHS